MEPRDLVKGRKRNDNGNRTAITGTRSQLAFFTTKPLLAAAHKKGHLAPLAGSRFSDNPPILASVWLSLLLPRTVHTCCRVRASIRTATKTSSERTRQRESDEQLTCSSSAQTRETPPWTWTRQPAANLLGKRRPASHLCALQRTCIPGTGRPRSLSTIRVAWFLREESVVCLCVCICGTPLT